LLTDGEVEDPKKVIEIAEKVSDNTRIHTFGIGGECDKEMVRLVAQVGNGSDYLIDNVSKLNPSVVKALARASGISIQHCNIKMGSESFSVNQIYQGEMYNKICFIDSDQLKKFKVIL